MQAAGRFVVLGAFVALTTQARAQSDLPLKHAPARTQTAITPADLMTRLYLYSDDSMMGRLAGSEYNLKATAYIASEVKRFGLVPAGDSGGYFQNVPLVKRQLDPSATLSVEGTAFRPWDEFIPRDPGRATRSFDGAQVIYAGVWPDSTMISADQAAGKFVVLGAHTGPGVPQAQQVNRGAILARYRGAAGIAVVALATFPPQAISFFRQPQTILREAPQATDTISLPVYVYVSAAGARQKPEFYFRKPHRARLDVVRRYARPGAQRRRHSAGQRSEIEGRVRRDRRPQRPHRLRPDAGRPRFAARVQRRPPQVGARRAQPSRVAGPGTAGPCECGQLAPRSRRAARFDLKRRG